MPARVMLEVFIILEHNKCNVPKELIFRAPWRETNPSKQAGNAPDYSSSLFEYNVQRMRSCYNRKEVSSIITPARY